MAIKESQYFTRKNTWLTQSGVKSEQFSQQLLVLQSVSWGRNTTSKLQLTAVRFLFTWRSTHTPTHTLTSADSHAALRCVHQHSTLPQLNIENHENTVTFPACPGARQRPPRGKPWSDGGCMMGRIEDSLTSAVLDLNLVIDQTWGESQGFMTDDCNTNSCWCFLFTSSPSSYCYTVVWCFTLIGSEALQEALRFGGDLNDQPCPWF